MLIHKPAQLSWEQAAGIPEVSFKWLKGFTIVSVEADASHRPGSLRQRFCISLESSRVVSLFYGTLAHLALALAASSWQLLVVLRLSTQQHGLMKNAISASIPWELPRLSTQEIRTGRTRC
jgi:hypothetical protein